MMTVVNLEQQSCTCKKELRPKGSKFSDVSKNKLLGNISANQLGLLVSVAVAFFLSPFVIKELGAQRYGIWILIVSMTGHYGLLTFGVRGALTRYLAEAIGKKDYEKIKEYIAVSFIMLSVASLLSVFIGIIFYLTIEKILIIPGPIIKEAKIICLVISFSTAVTFISSTFYSGLISQQKFLLINLVDTSMTLKRALLTYYFLSNGYGIVSLSVIGLALNIISGIFFYILFRKSFEKIEFNIFNAKLGTLKDFLSFGVRSLLINVSVMLVYHVDLIVIGTHLPLDRVTKYSLASSLSSYIVQIISSVGNVINPYVAVEYGRGGVSALKNIFIKQSQMMYIFGGFITAGCIVYSSSFFSLWVGPNFKESGIVFSILAAAQFFASGARVSNAIATATAKIGPVAKAAICEGVINLGISLGLIKLLGIFGVAWGTFIPLMAINGIWLPIYVCKLINMSKTNFFFSCFLPGLLFCLLSMIIGILLRMIIIPNSWITFFLNILVVTSLSFLGFLLFFNNRLTARPFLRRFTRNGVKPGIEL